MSAGAELCLAAFKGDFAKVKAIVAARPAATVQVVNSVNGPEFQSTALMWASDRGHKDIAEFLIANGANVDAKNKYGYTALMMAAVNDKRDLVELLLSRGASINAVDEDKSTAVMLATERGRASIVQLLIDRGADVTLHDEVSLGFSSRSSYRCLGGEHRSALRRAGRESQDRPHADQSRRQSGRPQQGRQHRAHLGCKTGLYSSRGAAAEQRSRC